MAAQGPHQFSVAVKVDIAITYVNAQGGLNLASRLCAAEHPDRCAPARATFKAVFNRFCSTGSVQVQGRRPPSNVNIFGHVELKNCHSEVAMFKYLLKV